MGFLCLLGCAQCLVALGAKALKFLLEFYIRIPRRRGRYERPYRKVSLGGARADVPDTELDSHFQTSQRLTVIASAIVHCGITEFPNVVQNIENPIRGRPFVLKAAQYISLSFTILRVAADESGMPTGQSLTELAQLDQAGTGIVLKIALREPAKVGKLTVQAVEELEITMVLIHWAIFARAGVKKQLVSVVPEHDSQGYCHGRAFGIAAVTSTSRSIPPSISPSRTQPSAWHQSS